MPPSEPDDLRALGRRIDEARGADRKDHDERTPSAFAIAFRFGTELVVAPVVCGGLGWLLDRWLHTTPIFLLILFILGAVAGIRNVIRAAAELNADAAKHPAAPVRDEDEE
ncbi:MAG TPA: AtpZ/AtpI family protein [Rhizomicrobium sp.]|jgi:ATP synthase protein I|nr:AtpZ/AtpI family protein [Rhizomicrobium sp.]